MNLYKKKFIIFIVINFLLSLPIYSQNPHKKSIQAIRLNGKINIDGRLLEPDWNGEAITDFTQRDPKEGEPASEPTEVFIRYDDEALYFGGKLHYKNVSDISSALFKRDDDPISDWIAFAIDSYYDKNTGFVFGVNPVGSIGDGIIYNDSWLDFSWNGVWDRATEKIDDGWSFEIKIPYSQIRFEEKEENKMGINIIRYILKKNEISYFAFTLKTESDQFVSSSRMADLVGIKNIKPPKRIEILPYIVGKNERLIHDKGDPFNTGNDYKGNLGADFKIGIGNNLTLDGTVLPDFGQVEVDPAQINLSAYETFFQEKRPFFIEGSSIFDFGSGGTNSNWNFNWPFSSLFYTRRIGKTPTLQSHDLIHSGYHHIPTQTRIFSAGKLSGKIGNWSLGAVSSLTAKEYGITQDSSGKRFEELVEPLTNYTVTRAQKQFDNGRHALGFITTTTFRELDNDKLKDMLNDRSITGGIDGWTTIDKDNVWVVAGLVSGSYISGNKNRLLSVQTNSAHYFQRPDAKHVSIDSNVTSITGWRARFRINKQKGNWKFNSAIGIISPGYEINDLGFNSRTDLINMHIAGGYVWYQTTDWFRYRAINIATARNYDFGGNKLYEVYWSGTEAIFSNYWGGGVNFAFNPEAINNQSTRGGPLMIYKSSISLNSWIFTDSRAKINTSLGGGGFISRSGSNNYYIWQDINFKPSNNFNITLGTNFSNDFDTFQYVDQIEDATAKSTFGKRYIFADLKQKTISSSIRINWIFTPTLTLQIYTQPFISIGEYSNFKELKRPKSFEFNKYGKDNGSTIKKDEDGNYNVITSNALNSFSFTIGNPDFNYKSLRGNVVLRWEYTPGSTLYLVWTRNGENGDNPGDFSFTKDFKKLVNSETNNIFLVKITYWWNPKIF